MTEPKLLKLQNSYFHRDFDGLSISTTTVIRVSFSFFLIPIHIFIGHSVKSKNCCWIMIARNLFMALDKQWNKQIMCFRKIPFDIYSSCENRSSLSSHFQSESNWLTEFYGTLLNLGWSKSYLLYTLEIEPPI